MGRRQARDMQLMLQFAVMMVNAFISFTRGTPPGWIWPIVIFSTAQSWVLLYVVSEHRLNLFKDLREWWDDLRDPPDYPWAS